MLEINDKRAFVVGIARAKLTFQSQPIIYTTYTRAKSFALNERKLLSYILVKAKADESAQAVAQRITDETDMVGLTADAFKRQSLAYFLRNTGILINFGFVVLVGFGVGAGATAIFAAVTRGGSGLAMTLNWQLLLGSGAAVLLIVMLAALISVCKVLTLEPAVVFKG